MKLCETERLLLRKYTVDDWPAVHSYGSVPENLVYMGWGPNTEEQTRVFIGMAIARAEELPCTNYHFAAIQKETGRLIGGCNLAISGDGAEIGWILHRDFWGHGFGTEMGKRLLELGFDELGLRRIAAHCDAENHASYRVMEKLGMRREGLFIEARAGNKNSGLPYGDELAYAVTKSEWDTHKEAARYTALPYVFDGFIDLPELSDDVIRLVCTAKKPAAPEKKWVPAYDFAVCKDSEKIGEVNLRIGYVTGLYYSGNVGYAIDEAHRGNGYAVRACSLLLPVARAHGMTKLHITNALTNTASRRVCEKLGARLLRIARLPEWHDIYKEGRRFSNIFEWSVE